MQFFTALTTIHIEMLVASDIWDSLILRLMSAPLNCLLALFRCSINYDYEMLTVTIVNTFFDVFLQTLQMQGTKLATTPQSGVLSASAFLRLHCSSRFF